MIWTCYVCVCPGNDEKLILHDALCESAVFCAVQVYLKVVLYLWYIQNSVNLDNDV